MFLFRGHWLFDNVILLSDEVFVWLIDGKFLYDKSLLRTSHSAYVATSTESNGVKIDGFLYPNFM